MLEPQRASQPEGDAGVLRRVPAEFLEPLPFVQIREEVLVSRAQFFRRDGRFSEEAIPGLCSDRHDGRSMHFIVRDALGRPAGLLRLTLAGEELSLPLQDKHVGFEIGPRDAEASRFIVDPGTRASFSAYRLAEAVVRTCVQHGVTNLYINPVLGGTGISPATYSRMFKAEDTGREAYQPLYDCMTRLMVIAGAEKLQAVGSELTRRVSRAWVRGAEQ